MWITTPSESDGSSKEPPMLLYTTPDHPTLGKMVPLLS